MKDTISRREFVPAIQGIGLVAGLLSGIPLKRAAAASKGEKPRLWRGFPRQDAALVRDVVGFAHTTESKVRELVEAKPALVNAGWDWGFGDWETALGAASHMGQRSIAEFLIERGARIDIFAAAMLGMADVVKAFVTAQPGVQRTLGPHGIPLLAHARAGGERAANTLRYLEGLGDADQGIGVAPLANELKPAYVGEYALEGMTPDRLEIKMDTSGQLRIEAKMEDGYVISRWIHYLGNGEFYPAGVGSVRLRFEVAGNKARSLTLVEREPILTAKRIGD